MAPGIYAKLRTSSAKFSNTWMSTMISAAASFCTYLHRLAEGSQHGPPVAISIVLGFKAISFL
eukprot:6185720-Pleurochrysis_carterae.AAC.1